MTAKKTLMTLSTLIAASLPPVPGQETGIEGRRAATAATFAQFAQLAEEIPLTLEDAWVGFSRLGVLREGDTPPVQARRLTCRQVADLISQEPPLGGNPVALASVFEAVAAHFLGSNDPRQKAMATTAAREAAELRA